MSATLGAGGDLERLTGRKNITRVPISEEWKRHGVGRRFFLFPGMSLNESECEELKCQLINQAGRAVALLPSELASQKFKSVLSTGCPSARIFDAHDIESSKIEFSESSKAVAVISNRYDGIDFPGDDSRLLLVEGLPKAMNLQERFFMSRMAANLLFNDRVQTRVLQAIGRCTRSMEDYSAVVVSGAELPDYLSDIKRRKFFHPELQAELSFGERQSKESTAKDMRENFQMFLANGLEWERANQQIIAERKNMNKLPFPAIEELGDVVRDEIDFQMRLWQGDFAEAHRASEKVLGKLMHTDLQGYRALWHYLSGCALWLLAQQGGSSDAKARMQFARAKDCAKGVAWLVGLSRFQPNPENIAADDSLLYAQLEKVELTLESLGTLHDRSFVRVERQILEGLRSTQKGTFESAHRWIGELLGFDARNVETTGAPDPWWILNSLCLVFEDHAGALDSSSLDVTKARQVSSHPNWIRANVPGSEVLRILPVLCTPVSKVQQGAVPHLTDVALWELPKFQKWAEQSLSVLRSLRTSFVEPGDLRWRTEAAEIFKANLMDGQSLFDHLQSQRANVLLKPVP